MRSPADSKRIAILDLASRGYLPAQLTREVEVSRQYVHAVLQGLAARMRRDRPERQREVRRSYHRALSAPGNQRLELLHRPYDAEALLGRIKQMLLDAPNSCD